jgi:hypothetical protein
MREQKHAPPTDTCAVANNLARKGRLKIGDKEVWGEGWVSVTHSCNISYSGQRDPEDWDSKPAWANSS